MKKLVLTALTLGLALASSQASARTFVIPGTICGPVLGSASCIEYGQYGAQNNCASVATVECPLPSDYANAGATNVYQTYFVAYDRNSGNTSTTNVSCTLQKTDFEGTLLYTASLSTSNGGAGSGSQIRTFFPNVSQGGFWRMRCSLPAVQAGAISHLTNLLVGTNE